ncbi:hypothetical protein DFA_01594 [Cavenderia fasciculata]|uniref:Uncharacterized protein n=1 Tax=Cavenderia fasciculata TaxID=261658 RepID=F4PTN8_CACFS|nr:uncharacterized protein DFA_01594 [Cavenderia fasciculata]EGG21708.1 hypothetical protein DFA_01594 [Cavenderia fasciculata]|eukprot:XP_004359558.1 hypothetical protein DFA_01594 [Cavenderia fasciculata]
MSSASSSSSSQQSSLSSTSTSMLLQGIQSTNLPSLVSNHHSVSSSTLDQIQGNTDNNKKSNSFVWNNHLKREEKVYQLSQLCQDNLDVLYSCEMEHGSNSSHCSRFQTNLQSCLSSNLCPDEAAMKNQQCNDTLSAASFLRSAIQQSSSPNAETFNKCFQLNKSINSCVNKNLEIIWKTIDE